MPRRALLVLAAMLLISGCTYMQQKQDLMSGGLASREADANAKFQAAKSQNQDLQDQQLQLDREVERNNKRIAAAQADLDRVSAELDAARQRKAVSEAEYRRLKGEVDKTHGDLASVNMQLDAERVTGNVDVAAKERQIQALEKEERAGEGARDVAGVVTSWATASHRQGAFGGATGRGHGGDSGGWSVAAAPRSRPAGMGRLQRPHERRLLRAGLRSRDRRSARPPDAGRGVPAATGCSVFVGETASPIDGRCCRATS